MHVTFPTMLQVLFMGGGQAWHSLCHQGARLPEPRRGIVHWMASATKMVARDSASERGCKISQQGNAGLTGWVSLIIVQNIAKKVMGEGEYVKKFIWTRTQSNLIKTQMKYISYGIYLCTKGFVVLYYVQILYLPHRRATLYKPCTYSTTLLALKKVQNPRNEAAIFVLQSLVHLHMYTKPNAFT